MDDRTSLSLAISDQYATLILFGHFSQNARRRSFWITKNYFRSHFPPFQINTQLCFAKWSPAAILDDRKSLSIAFIDISDQYPTSFFLEIFHKMSRQPFWITKNHFRSHFSPFQINTQFFIFQNGRQLPFVIPIFAKIDRDLPL